MRRKDREITDETKIIEIISKCHCCRLGFNDNGKVYIAPLSFGFEKRNGQYVFFFHGAREGRKIDLMKAEKFVGFELDTDYMLQEASVPCGYSAAFQSVIGTGEVSFVTDVKEKAEALRKIMFHNTGRTEWDFSPKMIESTFVFKMEVTEWSCKEHK